MHTAADIDRLHSRLAGARQPLVVSFLNAHAVNLACKDETFHEQMMASDILVRDGVGVKVAMQCLGREPGLNMCGTDLIPAILRHLPGRSLALYGTREPWLSAAAGIFLSGNPVCDRSDGFQPDHHYIERATRSGADIILLGMGMPKQERVAIAATGGHPRRPAVIINGGAVLDFVANRFRRAPAWMRSHGLEWLYRLTREPGRMFSRYLTGGLRFAIHVLVCYRVGRRAGSRGGPHEGGAPGAYPCFVGDLPETENGESQSGARVRRSSGVTMSRMPRVLAVGDHEHMRDEMARRLPRDPREAR